MSRFTNPLYLALMLAVVSIPFVVDYAFAKDGTIVWQGAVAVRKTYTVPKGKTLEIRSGTKVLFSKGATLSVKGTLKASGRKGEEILFTSAKWGKKVLGTRSCSITPVTASWNIAQSRMLPGGCTAMAPS